MIGRRVEDSRLAALSEATERRYAHLDGEEEFHALLRRVDELAADGIHDGLSAVDASTKAKLTETSTAARRAAARGTGAAATTCGKTAARGLATPHSAACAAPASQATKKRASVAGCKRGEYSHALASPPCVPLLAPSLGPSRCLPSRTVCSPSLAAAAADADSSRGPSKQPSVRRTVPKKTLFPELSPLERTRSQSTRLHLESCYIDAPLCLWEHVNRWLIPERCLDVDGPPPLPLLGSIPRDAYMTEATGGGVARQRLSGWSGGAAWVCLVACRTLAITAMARERQAAHCA